jgi:hypothetical protein
MSFCEHCEGQRFDRARVLRALRETKKTLGKRSPGEEALVRAITAVRALDIPHLEVIDETFDTKIVH